MKIVVVSAHPDDLEIGCSGTLKKYQDAGAEIISVITVKPSVETNSERNEDIVLDELKRSYTQTVVQI
jgi:LmbE family N-acetylglucosaminyl deacetylase